MQTFSSYRFVSAQTLAIRQNPRARSPEIARLTFGTPVQLLGTEGAFALIEWADSESEARIQGWVLEVAPLV